MPEQKPTRIEAANQSEPIERPAELRDRRSRPEGVVPKQSQSYVIAGLAVLILLAVLFSNNRARQTPPKPSAVIPIPAAEVNQRKIEQLKEDLTEEQRKSEQAQRSAAASATKSSAQPDNSSSSNPQSPASTEPPRDPVKDAERALAFKSRFASNLVSASDTATRNSSGPLESSRSELTAASNANEPRISPDAFPGAFASEMPRTAKPETTASAAKRAPQVNVNSAIGQPYVVFEGTILDTALVNRLDGEFSGPVKVMITNPVYSQDRQHILIPEGTFLLGEVQKVSGFGQKRLALAFHRLLMPDGYSVDLDRFHGLDQAGETGLKDKVNNHYLQIFGASVALGVIAGAAEGTANTGYNQNGSDAYRQGVASSLAQSSANVLDRFLSVPPTLTIREGHRVNVYFTQDLLLPAYENHTVPPNI